MVLLNRQTPASFGAYYAVAEAISKLQDFVVRRNDEFSAALPRKQTSRQISKEEQGSGAELW